MWRAGLSPLIAPLTLINRMGVAGWIHSSLMSCNDQSVLGVSSTCSNATSANIMASSLKQQKQICSDKEESTEDPLQRKQQWWSSGAGGFNNQSSSSLSLAQMRASSLVRGRRTSCFCCWRPPQLLLLICPPSKINYFTQSNPSCQSQRQFLWPVRPDHRTEIRTTSHHTETHHSAPPEHIAHTVERSCHYV